MSTIEQTDNDASDRVDPASVENPQVVTINLSSKSSRMVHRCYNILPAIKVGNNTVVPVPSFDLECGDPANVMAVGIEQREKKYKVATRNGVVNTWL